MFFADQLLSRRSGSSSAGHGSQSFSRPDASPIRTQVAVGQGGLKARYL